MSDNTNRIGFDFDASIVEHKLLDGLLKAARRALANAPFPSIRIAEGATLLDYPTADRPYHRITINGWTKTYSGPFNGDAHLKAHSGMCWSGERRIQAGGARMWAGATATVDGKSVAKSNSKAPDYDTIQDKGFAGYVSPERGEGYELGKTGAFVDRTDRPAPRAPLPDWTENRKMLKKKY